MVNILTQFKPGHGGEYTASSAITSYTADPGLTVTAWPGDPDSLYVEPNIDADAVYALSILFGGDEIDFNVHVLSSTQHGSYTQPQAFLVKGNSTLSYKPVVAP